MSEGKVVRRTDIPIAVGKPSAEQARRWLDTQIPYRNFAGVGAGDELGMKVASWVQNHVQRFRNRMQQTMDRWATNWAAANGEALWHENEDDVHVPETKKAIDSKVARIEEALLEFDPVFKVEGQKDELNRYKAQIIGAYTARLMDLAGYRDLVQPAARDAELCNIAAIKLRWEHLIDFAVDREIELSFRADETPYYKNVRRMREAVVRSGVRYSLVDPFKFFFDLDAATEEECEFIGDESTMFMHEIEALAETGVFSKKQVQVLKTQRAGTNAANGENGRFADLTDQFRLARSIASGPEYAGQEGGLHQPNRVRTLECWGWFNFGDTGIDGVVDPLGKKLTGSHRVVATVCAGVTVRFQLNPFDKKFTPYAVARINRSGHEMMAPANFDHVVQLNAQYDLVQSNILRSLSLAVAPFIITKGDTDLPDTLLGILPGSIMRATGEFEVVKLPALETNMVSYFNSTYRREIEEAAGALRVHENPQNTATETNRKVQEQQRMVRNSIRAVGEMLRQLALKTYWMSGQFATQPERFAVAGKAATVLGKSAMVTPDILQEDVDFRFLGVDSLHTFGDRRAAIRQFMNAWGPMLPTLPGVNIGGLARMDFELMVGAANIEEVFPEATPPWDTMPQEEENVMLLAGHQVAVSKRDNHREHIGKLLPMLKGPKTPAYIKGLLMEHLNEHLAAEQQQIAEQQAAEQQAMRDGAINSLMGGKPGTDKPPGPGGMEAGTKGLTNGPTQERTVSKTGRSGNGTSQSQAQGAA